MLKPGLCIFLECIMRFYNESENEKYWFLDSIQSLANKEIPVAILLHGMGGSGESELNSWNSILPDHILVAPTGYLNSWNIATEDSKAPANFRFSFHSKPQFYGPKIFASISSWSNFSPFLSISEP